MNSEVIAGVVVLYYPGECINNNISTYLKFLDKLYVVDNTPGGSEVNINLGPKIEVITFNENRGIGFALNYALEKSWKGGFNWLLTMDQDTSFRGIDCEKLIKLANQLYKKNQRVAVVSASDKSPKSIKLKINNICITSGSLVNVTAARSINGWNELLFVDGVDYDFSLRMINNKYITVQDEKIKLNHQLGSPLEFNVGGLTLVTYIHQPLRTYYCFRSAFFLIRSFWKTNPLISMSLIISMFRYLMKILLLPNRIEHLIMVKKGIVDFRLNNLGRLDESKC